jgi:hypothetical protein
MVQIIDTLPDPFRPRWRLPIVAAGLGVGLSFWFMIIGIFG